jgi:hypothetical protein
MLKVGHTGMHIPDPQHATCLWANVPIEIWWGVDFPTTGKEDRCRIKHSALLS